MDCLERTIDNLAEAGFNMMTVNLEYRFDFPSCPGLAPPGSLTPEQARELVAYGRERGVEVVPQPNLIGHCEGMGATELYSHLTADPYQQGPWGGAEQLNLELPEARKLVAAMMHDVLEAFPGEYVHIGCDEVRRMAYLFHDDPDRQVKTMLEHLRFVLDLARQSGRQVMLWGDMALKHEDLMQSLPRDVIVCDWFYGAEGRRESLEWFKSEGFRVVACPAVPTFNTYAIDVDVAHANLSHMIADAAELGLDGFLLTLWEFGFGSGLDLIWPWVAMAGEIAKGNRVDDPDAFVAHFAAERYGVDGRDFMRLHELLSREFQAAVEAEGAPADSLRRLRKGLFRATDHLSTLARPHPVPANHAQQLSEPSPFHAWLYLRPILSDERMARLEAMADEVAELIDGLDQQTERHAEEMIPLLGLAEAFVIMVGRVRVLSEAKQTYHKAAEAQPTDPATFRQALDATAEALDKLRPGLHVLMRHVEQLEGTTGLAPSERRWLEVHEASLDEHIAALQARQPTNDSLLEFGEFLKRPANCTPRVTWR